MLDERLFGLCLMSVHREKIKKVKQGFIVRVFDRLGRDPDVCSFVFRLK